MALTRQNLPIPFSTSIDQKQDPLQNMPTNMASLINAVYTKDKQITKRNGYKVLTTLPDGSNVTGLTTFNSNLTALGNAVYAYSAASQQWLDHGRYQPVELSVQPLVRSSLSQIEADSAVSSNGLVCTVYMDTDLRYQITDSHGSVLIPSTTIINDASCGRVIVVGNYFVITFITTITATPHLQYIAVPLANLSNPTAPTDISDEVDSNPTGYDVVVDGTTWYVAWNASDIGGAIQLASYNANLAQQGTATLATAVGDLISLCVDNTGSSPVLWLSYYTSADTEWWAATFSSPILNNILPPTSIDDTKTLIAITGLAADGVFTGLAQVENTITGNTLTYRSDYIEVAEVTDAGVVTGPTVLVRSVGLASKPFTYLDETYILTVYPGQIEPTYLLIDLNGEAVARVASSNASGYVTNNILPIVWLYGAVASMGYLIRDLLVSVAKTTNVTPNNAPANVYTQNGVNLLNIDLDVKNPVSVEVGNDLYMAGGFLWMYDGSATCEQGFHVFPENVDYEGDVTGGLMTDQQYYYQVTYEWTDASGNIHRSAPSVPVGVNLSGTGGTGIVTLTISTLRVTYKQEVRICVYRWSVGQQNYFETTSVLSPTMNDPSVDTIDFIDTHSDAQILGNPLLYTTGGVVEDLPGPACKAIALYKSRLFLADSEDPNLLWYSKQVIEGTPVEMSDLFTQFIAPTTGVQASTGPTQALSSMDDKLIAFKENAMYYMVGLGPDNTGANNDLTDPVYISSTVGTSNQQSIAFIPIGLMFQSNKGIWLLGRDLSTSYIGAPVEDDSLSTAVTAVVVPPGTNQVRIHLQDSSTLMYDYYFQRWATFNNPSAVSDTLFQSLHTYLDKYGRVFQETPNLYIDGVRPVLLSFQTVWLNLAGLQGFQRASMLYILGEYKTPHKISVQIGYDYEDGPTQSLILSPSQAYSTWGSDTYWGDASVWGSTTSLEQFRIFLSRQKMQAFQVAFAEQWDSSQGVAAGQGLTVSGLNAVISLKKGYVPLAASQSVG